MRRRKVQQGWERSQWLVNFRIDCKYLKHEVREEWQARWNSILYILFERILIGSKDRTCSRFGKITGAGHNVATDRLRRRRQTPEERLTSREVSNSIFTVVTPTFSVASWSINARECECNVDNSDTHVSAAVSWFSHINCDINALPYLGAEPRACAHGDFNGKISTINVEPFSIIVRRNATVGR